MDADLVDRLGGPRGVAEYVNFLIGAANLVFEEELGARLNVVRIEETDAFDGAATLRDG